MHYIESGVGEPLVLLHAFPVDARMWNGARARLEEHARVITPDQRGLGESPLDGASARSLSEPRERAAAAASPSLDLVATDVLALLDRVGVRRAVFGGCSMGGYVAMAILRTAPERVAGLLFADTKAAADDEQQRAGRLEVADRAEREGTAGWLADNTVPTVLGSTTRERRPDVVERVRELVDSQPPDGVAWAQRAMAARPDSSEVLRSFTGPALVVVGEEDTLTTPDHARELAGLLPAADFVTLPRVGHLAPVEAPDAFADAVLRWLS
ncbi:alpha/beta fold hydrolase [Saccharopolyspora rosea]|uniref:Alpha/beta fold hydrolase n=1 Tax=Saccharopolyspora rosea TaxID=524884 RepID=A0ABW3FWF3_9PSEU|nr:alpha/beta hydrolase [Saccharopolyspora rosea]